jgi:thiol-disulfide isomerase/thioredoxin
MAPMTQLPSATPPVPFCVLIGRKLDNFALYDLNHQVWEYRRDRKGRLVLLDFWFSSCPSCLQAIPHLSALHRQYSSYGLEVVGIAGEPSTKPAEQAQKAAALRSRYNIPYTLLVAGGGAGPCPVQTQFQVQVYPTLVLLDDSGQIVWRSEGLEGNARLELQREINRRLGIPPR